MRRRFTILSLSICLPAAACQRGAPEASPSVSSLNAANRLPTGRMLDPVGDAIEVGSMPLAATLSPDGRQILVLLNGYREQGVQIVDRASGRLLQTLVSPRHSSDCPSRPMERRSTRPAEIRMSFIGIRGPMGARRSPTASFLQRKPLAPTARAIRADSRRLPTDDSSTSPRTSPIRSR